MATTKPPRAPAAAKAAAPRANGAKRTRAAAADASTSPSAPPSIPAQRDMLALMHLIRTFEDAAAREYTRGNVAGFLHLYNGCEASGVGVLSAVRPDDFAMGNYRDHGHALARGVPANALMAELFGKVDGVCKGRGGSMHFFSKEHNYLGGWAIVGGQLPVSVGYQFATEYKRTVMKEDVDSIGVCFLGEGSTNIGYFYETMNFAKLWHVPVVFVVENNLYAMGTPLAFHSSVHNMADKGRSFGIEAETCDGMDVLAVHAAMSAAVERARTTREPQFLEVMTYRYRAHSMADPDLYRTKDEIEKWRKRDAIEQLKHALIEGDHLTEDEFAAMVKVNEKTVTDAVAFATASPEPPLSDLMAYIPVPPPPPPAVAATRAQTTQAAQRLGDFSTRDGGPRRRSSFRSCRRSGALTTSRRAGFVSLLVPNAGALNLGKFAKKGDVRRVCAARAFGSVDWRRRRAERPRRHAACVGRSCASAC